MSVNNRPITNTIQSLRIGLASPEKIIAWSHGEVKKPETFNYRTYKPEKDGLFCERIFGPVKDYECACGKYKKKRYKGIVCERCGVEVTSNRVRRERLGHIRLASPVAHIWFTKSIPNRFSALLGISGKEIEKVIYFVSWIVVDVDEEWMLKKGDDLEDLVAREIESLNSEEEGLRQHETINLFELAKKADIDSNRKREITLLAKSLSNRPPDINDDKMEGKIESVKEDILQAKLHEPYMLAEFAADSETGEIIALPRDKFNFAVLSKAFYLGKYDLVMENVEMEIEASKRIEEINNQVRAYQRAIDLVKRIHIMDRLNDQDHEDYNQLRQLCLMRDMGDLNEHISIGIGAQAVQEILRHLDLEKLETDLLKEIETATSQKKQKLIKRIKVVRGFINSGNQADWMIMSVLPVLPPELRPMVELEGGRFASSDLNDLYRRVINRNNRLKKLIDIRAPESILRNERRMLQEAVDALIDNGRKGRAAVNVNNRALRSLSDMLKGKQGRFRQNLLGKRVDYSGRSVIVVGPSLKLHQCGLPKYMALELFKPFVLNKLINPDDPEQNIAQARRVLERAEDPRVWDALEEITRSHPVLLNRAPTLHRLSIQAFEPVLIEGKAIQLHPLVCAAFNADFDGDQMAVHVPLSTAAQAEARLLMLSANNLLSPADGKPIISPTHDVVLGLFYLTQVLIGEEASSSVEDLEEHFNSIPVEKRHEELPTFMSVKDALLAYENGNIRMQQPVRVQLARPWTTQVDSVEPARPAGEFVITSAGRMIFNDQIHVVMESVFDNPELYPLPYFNCAMDKGKISGLIARAYQAGGQYFTVKLSDTIKDLGFEMATQSGLTIAASDIIVPREKKPILSEADKEADDIWSKYKKRVITESEKDDAVTRIWDQATKDLTKAMRENFPPLNSVYMMATSGARGKMDQVRQLAAMRGLLVGPSGRVLDFPIKSNFREGLSVFEYFISTHGGRKGLVDTALKTADSGYLTRRLIDVALDVSVIEDNCGTSDGIEPKHPLSETMLTTREFEEIRDWLNTIKLKLADMSPDLLQNIRLRQRTYLPVFRKCLDSRVAAIERKKEQLAVLLDEEGAPVWKQVDIFESLGTAPEESSEGLSEITAELDQHIEAITQQAADAKEQSSNLAASLKESKVELKEDYGKLHAHLSEEALQDMLEELSSLEPDNNEYAEVRQLSLSLVSDLKKKMPADVKRAHAYVEKISNLLVALRNAAEATGVPDAKGVTTSLDAVASEAQATMDKYAAVMNLDKLTKAFNNLSKTLKKNLKAKPKTREDYQSKLKDLSSARDSFANALSKFDYEQQDYVDVKTIQVLLDELADKFVAAIEKLSNLDAQRESRLERSKAIRDVIARQLHDIRLTCAQYEEMVTALREFAGSDLDTSIQAPFKGTGPEADLPALPDSDLRGYIGAELKKLTAVVAKLEPEHAAIIDWQSELLEDDKLSLDKQSNAEGDLIGALSAFDMFIKELDVPSIPGKLQGKWQKIFKGRYLAQDVEMDFGDGLELVLPKDTLLTIDFANHLLVANILALLSPDQTTPPVIKVRSPLTCRTLGGVCAHCYGWELASETPSQVGDPVGVVAAQSIGEPGTQLTMRTFHTGGIKGRDITQGLPYVETLFEVRGVKHPTVLAEEDGEVISITEMVYEKIAIQSKDHSRDKTYEVVHPYHQRLNVHFRSNVKAGEPLDKDETVLVDFDGIVTQLFTDAHRTYWLIKIRHADGSETTYETPHENHRPLVIVGQKVHKGDQLCEGDLDLRKYHTLMGDLATQLYITNKIQDIYESQNVNTNSKHIEVITKQMIRFVEITDPAEEKDLYEGDLVDRNFFQQLLEQREKEGKPLPEGKSLLQGISKSSLSTESFLAAASFQETTRVLTEAAIEGKVDVLSGLKENVIIGGLIPVGTGRMSTAIEEKVADLVFGEMEEAPADEAPSESVF